MNLVRKKCFGKRMLIEMLLSSDLYHTHTNKKRNNKMAGPGAKGI